MTMIPMTDNLPGHTTVRYSAIPSGLTTRHVIQNIFHRLTIRQGTLSHLTIRLVFTALAFMRM